LPGKIILLNKTKIILNKTYIFLIFMVFVGVLWNTKF